MLSAGANLREKD